VHVLIDSHNRARHNAMMSERRRAALVLLIGGALLLGHTGCTDDASAPKGVAQPARASSPLSARALHPTAPSREPTPAAEPGRLDAGRVGPAAEPAASLTVEIEADPDIGRAPLMVHFRALLEGGTGPFTYAWDFGDGGHDTGSAATYTYELPGSYTATLVVTDSLGASGHQEVGVQVDPTDDGDAAP
jgi:hypothetical protein